MRTALADRTQTDADAWDGERTSYSVSGQLCAEYRGLDDPLNNIIGSSETVAVSLSWNRAGVGISFLMENALVAGSAPFGRGDGDLLFLLSVEGFATPGNPGAVKVDVTGG